MVRTTDVAASTSRERALSGVLRKAWESSDMTMRTVAKQLGKSHSTLSRWFNGEVVPDIEDVAGILGVLGVVGDKRDEILALTRVSGLGPAWVTSGPTGVSQQLTGSMEMEATAASMFEWSPLVVPGLLQTESYARAIVGANDKLKPGEVNHLVTLRLGRQHAIRRDDPIQLTAILGLPAIQGGIGGSQIMAGQLRHLLKVSTDVDAVTLLLARVDGGWHGGLLGTFVLYEFDAPLPSIVSLEHHRTGSFIDDPDDVAAYTELATDLRELAYSPDETRDLLRQEVATKETP
jgi:transcriptional regulator with XRE-family HTH domain